LPSGELFSLEGILSRFTFAARIGRLSSYSEIPKEVFPMADMLETMFDLQKKLNKRVGVDTDSMTDEDRAKWLLNYARALGQELAELVDSVPWKWWAQYQSFDKHNAKVEIIDMFHFLMSLALTLGLSAKDVFEAYLRKNKVNLDRQEEGYLFKDESDNLGI
jgi:dimeric dUTPase (all-alpha-NTP-PPase superfamily)